MLANTLLPSQSRTCTRMADWPLETSRASQYIRPQRKHNTFSDSLLSFWVCQEAEREELSPRGREMPPAPRGMDPRMPHPNAMVGSGGQMLHPHMAQGRPPPGMGAEHLHGKVGGGHCQTPVLHGRLFIIKTNFTPFTQYHLLLLIFAVNVAESVKHFKLFCLKVFGL